MFNPKVSVLVFAVLMVGPVSMAFATDGKGVYEKSCNMCHGAGIAGAPKFGDKAAWQARLAKGVAVLEQSAINGIGAMPAKGGNKKLSDDEVKAAVAHMVSAAK
ncbi:MAG: c-type cytochrome [Gammaproteobacteria bacterium]|nr:c-type cytochrome [Gammaproteobacteria bacterium]